MRPRATIIPLLTLCFSINAMAAPASKEDFNKLWISLKESCNLASEGLFRLSPGAEELNKCVKDNFKSCLSLSCDKSDINLLAALIKKYLGLHDPFIPAEFYKHAVTIGQTKDDATAIKEATTLFATIFKTHPESEKLLKFLFTEMLPYLLDFQAKTKMDLNNLAVVFAPNLIAIPKDVPLTDQAMAQQSALPKFFFVAYRALFTDSDQLKAARKKEQDAIAKKVQLRSIGKKMQNIPKH